MSDNSKIYENLLDFRRKGSNLAWITRKLNLKLSYKQPKLITPAYLKEAVLASPKIQDLLSKLSDASRSDATQTVRELLEEIAFTRNWKLIRFLGLILTRICLKVSSGIYVNKEKIEQLKSKMGHCPVILIPNHRSYIDFILMSYVCFTYNIAIPAIAAGMDFHGMVGMGSVLRNTGAFFMRRSYNDDTLYWTTFKEYINEITKEGDSPIEFFIEGTRSRSNKSLMPKYGLLTMILKAFFFGEVPDIYFVPVNISYDRIFEESLFAYELLGIPKPKESTSGLFKSLKILKENYGKIYYTFDDPISAKEFFAGKLNRSLHSIPPLHLQELTQSEKNLLPPLAHEFVYRQQKCSVTTVFNLMAVIINHNLTIGRNLSIEELKIEMYWLRNTIESFGGFIHTENFENDIKDAFNVHGNLIRLSSDNQVDLVKGNIEDNNVKPNVFKAHSLSGRILMESLPFVMLQIYMNPVLQYFVDGAVLVTVLDQSGKLLKDELFKSYHFLRTLFLLEFVSSESRLKHEFEQSLSTLISLNVIERETEYYKLTQNNKLQNVLVISIKPFLYTYVTMLAVLKNIPNICDEKTILANTQMVIEKAMTEQKEFIHPYCLNLDSLGNCLGSLVSLGVLKRTRREIKNFYESDIKGIVELLNKLETVSGFSSTVEVFIPSLQQSKL